MDNYLAAKKILFDTTNSDEFAIINADSDYAEKIAKDAKAQVLTYALEGPADFQAIKLEEDELITRFDLVYKDEIITFQTELVGRYNVHNLLAAIIVSYKQGIRWHVHQI